MLADIVFLIIDTATFFLTLVFLLRFFMQWQRIPFRNTLGHFIVTTTDWAVRPLRRVVPGFFGLDLASLLLAWCVQMLLVLAKLSLGSAVPLDIGVLPLILSFGLIGVGKTAVWIVFGVVLISSILSWVNPMTPVAPVLNALAEPFLRPFRRILPPIGNVDLSPILLLLALQIILIVLNGFARQLL